MRHIYITILFCLGYSCIAQSLSVTVTDIADGESIPMANVVVKRGQTIVQGGMVDFEGVSIISPIDTGVYDVEVSFVGYDTTEINGVIIFPSKRTYLNVQLFESNEIIEEFIYEENYIPIKECYISNRNHSYIEVKPIPRVINLDTLVVDVIRSL